jgi:hypothetical protein
MSNSKIASAVIGALDDLSKLVATHEFKKMLEELWSVPEPFRHEFVEVVVLDPEELARRNIRVPNDISIQRSWFADERPTLFCVTKYLPNDVGWKKVTVTIDNPINESSKVGWVPD